MSTNAIKSAELINGKFIHMVFFWLKEPSNVEQCSFFLDGLNHFINQMDMIRATHIGTPAETRRPNVDSTYTYSLLVTFDSKDEHDVYQEHKAHRKFIDELKHMWEKVQIYDSTLG